MAPVRKKGGNKGKEKEKLKMGDLVFAKVKGFPPWPAKISNPKLWKQPPDPKKYFVEFFGTGEIGFVAPADTQLFTNESKSKVLARRSGKTIKYFSQAIEEICEAFEVLEQKSPGGIGETIDASETAIDDCKHQESHEKAYSEDTEENFEQGDTDKEDEFHASECSSQSRKGTASVVKPRGLNGMESPVLSDGNRNRESSDAIRKHKKGNIPVAKVASSTSLDKKDNYVSHTLEINEKGDMETVPNGYTSSEKQAYCNSEVHSDMVDGDHQGCTGNLSIDVEDAVNVHNMEAKDNEIAVMAHEAEIKADSSLIMKKSHNPHNRTINISAKEEKQLGAGAGKSAKSSRRSSTVANRGKSLKKSRAVSSEKVSPHRVSNRPKPNTIDGKASERLSSDVQGKESQLRNRKRVMSNAEHSRPAKRSKIVEEFDNVKKISQKSDSSHLASKGRGDKAVKTKNCVISGKAEIDMTSTTKTQQDRSHIVVNEAVLPLSKRRNWARESTSVSASKSVPCKTGRSPNFLKDDISTSDDERSPITHVHARRRSFLLDDDDEEEVHRTPIHKASTSILNTTHANGQAAESCRDNTLAISNNSIVNKQSNTDLTCLSDRTFPVKEDPQESKEIKVENDAGPPVFHTSEKLEYQKSSIRDENPIAASPKISVDVGCTVESTEHRPIKSQARSSISLPLKKVEVSSSKFSLQDSETSNHTDNQATMRKNKSFSTPEKLNVKPKPNSELNGIMENRSNINFSAEPNIEIAALSEKRSDAVNDEKAANSSIASKVSDSDKSLKHLIAAAQAKRRVAQSLSQLHDNAVAALTNPPMIGGRIPSPVSAVHSFSKETSFQKDGKGLRPTTHTSPSAPDKQLTSADRIDHQEHGCKASPAYRQFDGSPSGTEAAIARDALEGMLETLSRTKESIGRATRLAINCAKYGIASEVVELLIRKLESEPSLHRRIDLFFLVDSITQCSHSHKGIAGASYIPVVETALPRLLGAAAPPGAGAQENRRQCLKVLRLWLERKILPELLLRRYMDDIEVPKDDLSAGIFHRRPSRAERSVDDPIREMEGMLVDEYGSNATFQLPGLFLSSNIFEDEDYLSSDICKDTGKQSPVEAGSSLEKQDTCIGPGDRCLRALEDVVCEHEMEDLASCSKDENLLRNGSLELGSQYHNFGTAMQSELGIQNEFPPLPSGLPPLPLESPSPPPPLPSSPPPLPSPPPPPPPSSPPPPPPLPPGLPPHQSFPNPPLPVSPPPSLYISAVHDYCMDPSGNQLQTSGNSFNGHGNTALKGDMALQQHASVVRPGNCNMQPMPGFTSLRPFEYGHNDVYCAPQASIPTQQFQQVGGSFHQRPFCPLPAQLPPSHPLPTAQPPPSHPLPTAQTPSNHFSYAEPTAQQNVQQQYNPYCLPSHRDGRRQYGIDEQWLAHTNEINPDNQQNTWVGGRRGQPSSETHFGNEGYLRPNMERPPSHSMAFQHQLNTSMPSRASVPGHRYPQMLACRPDASALNRWRPV